MYDRKQVWLSQGKLIKTNSSKMSESVEDLFLSQLKQIQASLLKQNSTKEEDSVPIIKISKNDSMKRKIDQITTNLQKKEIVIIASYSNGIPKQISITEIVKQQLKDNGKIVKQFNKLSKFESISNPNEKKKPEKEPTEDDEAYKTCLESIRSPHMFILPTMYILLTVGELVDQFDLGGWTIQ